MSASSQVVGTYRGKSERVAHHKGARPVRQPKYVRRRPTLPRGRPRSTIGADRLSFRVRNVTGRFTIAMTAETLWSYNG